MMTSQEEADEAVAKIEKEMLAKIREKMPQLSHLFEKMSVSGGDAAGSSPTPNNANAALHTIDEDLEDEDDIVSL